MFVVLEKWKDIRKLCRLIIRSLLVGYLLLFLEQNITYVLFEKDKQ